MTDTFLDINLIIVQQFYNYNMFTEINILLHPRYNFSLKVRNYRISSLLSFILNSFCLLLCLTFSPK